MVEFIRRFLPERFRNRYPSAFLEANLRGNIDFPQMFTAQTLKGGVQIAREVLDHKITWDNFQNAKLTRRQLTTIREKIFKAHKSHDIPYVPVGINKKAEYQYRLRHPNLKQFSNADIIRILNDERFITINAAYKYAIDVIPKDSQPESGYRAIEFAGIERSIIDPIPILTLLFSSPTYAREVRTLVEIWQTAASVLDTERAKRLGKELRESFRTLHDPNDGLDKAGKKELALKLRKTVWDRVKNDLGSLIASELKSHFPNVDSNILETFIKNTCLPVVPQEPEEYRSS